MHKVKRLEFDAVIITPSVTSLSFNLKQNAPYTVSSEKEQIIRKSGILDYFPKNENLKDVGGMEVLKNWLSTRRRAYEKKLEILDCKNRKDFFCSVFLDVERVLLQK